ncbi:MAG: Rne/Rng family ribonuclease [Paludibacteraceae bacterium]|nr:Rne/Rng family ribonuclease [Paludibacteraceae bacterium]
MNNELVIDVQASKIAIALLEEKRLVELNKETSSASFSVGDIYLARVRKLMPGLNAAFVDVGYEKGAFLHYQDLGPQFSSVMAYTKELLNNRKRIPDLSKFQMKKDLEKNGSISDVLAQGQEIFVQIAKEPISTKGPRLTSEISIAGRYIVLMPFADKVYVSQKIKSHEERNRIKQLMRSIKPKNFGVIVRTVAEGVDINELDAELHALVKKWQDGVAKASKSTKTPVLLCEESSRTVSILRDIFNPTFESIHVNDRAVYEEVCDYVKQIAPDRVSIVKYYDGELPIFDHFGVTKQVKSGFGRTVSFKNGAYLIIEHTEAMHVIDVNSGNKTRAGNDQEANAIEVNLAAGDEIARQLRLRDMGGIIVVDFIDMMKAENRQKLYDRMRENMAHDRARHNILQLSKFGLMQITRQRVRPEMHVDTEEVCPTCYGKGVSQPSILFVDALENKMDYLTNTLNIRKFKLLVHPYVAAFINQGFPFMTQKWKWRRKFKASFSLVPSQNLSFLEYHFLDEHGTEIDLKEEVETLSTKKGE